ncbi:MAG: ABC transporter permease subunit [Lachnospiraceae bacterium]|nr:ABC transporter permease subunit [Lachnospiraceae bacterium]
MRLYKMELYKLCCKKIFIIGAVCVIVIVLFAFWLKVNGEESTVDGVKYTGLQAVRVNRQITEEFKGILTDEKAEKIVEKYGFPSEVELYFGYYSNANYLNGWVERMLSDGDYYDWDNYKIATVIYPIEDTELEKARELTGTELVLDYSDGWVTFLDVMQIGLLLGSILILFGTSTVFAGEKQNNTQQLLFTTKEGRGSDIYSKMAAAFTVAFNVWFSVIILDLALCGMVYGFSGLKCLVGTTSIAYYHVITYLPYTMWTIGTMIVTVLLRSLLGVFLLCAMTICISAYMKSTFNAVVLAAILWVLPILLWILIREGGQNFNSYIIISIVISIIRYFIFASPIYSVFYDTVSDGSRILTLLSVIAAAGVVLFSAGAYRKYKRQQVV